MNRDSLKDFFYEKVWKVNSDVNGQGRSYGWTNCHWNDLLKAIDEYADTRRDQPKSAGQELTSENYLSALADARFGDVAPFLGQRCPDCQGAAESDAEFEHVKFGGSIVIGCDSTLLVNPGLLGFAEEIWFDSRYEESEIVREDASVWGDHTGSVWRTGAKVRPARPEEHADGLAGTLERIELEHDYGFTRATFWVQWENNTSGPDSHQSGDIVLI
ncbi:hypothetical protein ACJ6WD_10695 [Streptomyces sp. VTCC 41912]|uniref:hypothetical protein n=1 Tax=Streptomyces sp. VTCC 41912 TaxID=3383243 RepID=UPI0038968573